MPMHKSLFCQRSSVLRDRLVWMDLEMTGLDPDRESIIEIATIVTEGDLKLVAEGPSFAISTPEELIAGMDEWNTTHHNASGLVERVRTEGVSMAEAEQRTLEFLHEHCEPGRLPLCGSSIHHDRRFLRRYMPELNEFFHYRNVDVSSIKEVVRRWHPRSPKFRKNSGHRALDDTRGSIAELAHYREHNFESGR
ncbi:MAG: oligoribonuclease [Candidatus Thermoplasmatota archaeon]|nr:oligoribonuclease [Candidatus Thermoplasmatota archaeon]